MVSHALRALMAFLTAVSVVAVGFQPADAAAPTKTLTYHGEQFQVPRAWAVHDLGSESSVCPRMDRHAVYLGPNTGKARCPAHLVGVTDAVQVQPWDGTPPAGAQATMIEGQQAQVNGAEAEATSHRVVAAFPAAGVLATISYSTDSAVAHKILASFAAVGPAPATRMAPSLTPQASSPGVGPVTYTGKGFDTCDAPSESAMSAWRRASPYDAVGIYIGGVNRACSQSNLSQKWVRDEVAAGWHLVPLYVGLQAPCSGFTPINSSRAASQGTAAAIDAVAQANSYGIGAGNPIYFDMEAWNTSNSACSSAVVNFIKAWTIELGKKGYHSGIYSSASPIGAVIAPLYGKTGGPQYLYFAQWNGIASTTTSYFPDSTWPNHRRIKQYTGNVTETHGGVTLNIDRDYSNGLVVGDPKPAITGISPRSSAVGTTVVLTGRGFQAGHTTVKFGGVASHSVNVSSGQRLTASVPARTIRTVNITVTTPGGTSNVSTGTRFTYRPLIAAAVDPSTGGYRFTTPQGNVYAFHTDWYGATADKKLPAPIVDMATDPKTGGYWLVTSKGNVYNFHAPWYGSTAHTNLPAPIVGITADPTTGGYWLITSKGNIYGFNAPWYGAPVHRNPPAPIVSMAADPATGGYWATTTKGNVYNFHAPWYGSTAHTNLPAPIVGITADPTTGGYWATTTKGNVYNFHAPWYGSASHRSPLTSVTRIKTSGDGYVQTTRAGRVYNFNAPWYGAPAAR